MAPHSNTLAWKIPWAEEPDRLQSMGSRRVGHDWATSLSFFPFLHWRRKWQPTPVFLPGESQGQGSLVGCCLWGCTESDTTEATWQQQQHSSSTFNFFWGNSILFFIVAEPIYNPTNSVQISLFSISWPIPVLACLFVNNQSDLCMVIAHWGFDLHFPND